MLYRKHLNRRTLLRGALHGAGGVAIGLPFIKEMSRRSVYAAPPEPPARAFTVFHGLGYPTPIQTEGYEGRNGWLATAEPLLPFKDKMCMVRGVHQTRTDASENAHHDGAGAAFCGTRIRTRSQSGGASVDLALRNAAYPQGLPAGLIPSLVMGTWFRRGGESVRYIHSRNEDGSPTASPIETPRELFSRIFGDLPELPGQMVDPEAFARQQRLGRSVLDSVLQQYQHYTTSAGGLSPDSRTRIASHFDHIREIEMRAFGGAMGMVDAEACKRHESEPAESVLPHGSAADPGGQGVDVTVEQLVGEWRLMSDLYALAVVCDRVRFGGVMFQSAGERIRLEGEYEFGGRHVHRFDDRGRRGGGASGCSHEYWHGYNPDQENAELRAHLHLMMREVAYFLGLLDDPTFADQNGRTILENSLVVVSTESGDGRHQDSTRELSGVFHYVSNANERFKTGIVDVDHHGVDLYNTMLTAYGAPPSLDGTGEQVDAILA